MITLDVALVAVVYVFCVVSCAAHSALWMDEALALAAATQPNWRGVLHVIWVGTDFSPPTYHLLLHALPGLSTHTRLVARLPSMLAVFGAGLCIAAIVRRRYAAPFGAVALATTLASPLFFYASQVRPYALTTFCLAAALAAWDRLPDSGRPSRAQMVGLWALLASCLSLHFYGIVSVGALVLCEILWSVHARTVRAPVWAMFAALVPVLLAWLPLSMHLRAISEADQVGAGFYGYPTLARLFMAVIYYGFGTLEQMPLYAGLLAALLWHAAALSGKSGDTARPADANFVIIILAVAAIPFGAYALSIVGTGSFVERYAVGASLLPGLLITQAAATWAHARRTPVIMIIAAALSLFMQRGAIPTTQLLADVKSILDHHPGQPVLVGDGALYIELVDFLLPSDLARVAYLVPPDDVPRPDPTNEHEVQRLASLDSHYRRVPYDRAMARAGGFAYLRATPANPDLPLAQILRRGGVARLIDHNDLVDFYHIQPTANGNVP